MYRKSDFQTMLDELTDAKNSLVQHNGYMPRQWVFGLIPRVPGHLLEENSDLPYLDPEGRCHKCRMAAIETEANAKIRKSLIGRSRPMRGNYVPGDLVCYWRAGNGVHQAQGQWLGPARVIGVEGGNVSVSHRATAIKCAKEQLRMASPAEREMREMPMRIGGDDPDERSKHGVPRQQDLMTTVRKDIDFGAWDFGNFRFKGRQISQMPNGEIVCDMEQYKHELEQIDVSKADKTKPERVLNSKEHTQFRGGVGSLGWFVDHFCPQLSFQLADLRRKQASPTVQDLLKLNKVIRAAKVIDSKIKIRSIPVEHLRFMGVHDAGHANLEGGASQQGHLILAVHASITNCRVPVSVLSWQSKKIKRVVRSSLAAETCSMSTCQEHLDWIRTIVGTDDPQ